MEHLVVVDAYQARCEPTTSSVDDEGAVLGLPIGSLVDLLGCEATVVRWDAWHAYERVPHAFTSWESLSPHTRLVELSPAHTPVVDESLSIRTRSIAASDPESGRPFADGLAPRIRGLLAENDPHLLAGYCLREELTRIHRDRPIDLLIVPVWGGLGYLVQMDRAVGAGSLARTPVAVVATDTSANLWAANEEGRWTRALIGRQQREELSLALADLAIAYGPRGLSLAVRGRVRGSSAPVLGARHFSPALITRLQTAATVSRDVSEVGHVVAGHCMPASGTLVTLDAARMLRDAKTPLRRPIAITGMDTVFAPMRPRSFTGYWSTRGWVRGLVESGHWVWSTSQNTAPSSLRVRLQPSFFEHLSNAAEELASGSLVALSSAALDGLLPGDRVPDLVKLDPEAGPARLAEQVRRLDSTPLSELDAVRRSLCEAVLESAAHGPQRTRAVAAALRAVVDDSRCRTPLATVMQRQLDPRRPLGTGGAAPSTVSVSRPESDTFAVVVPCHDLGTLLVECVNSVWASSRIPDELIVVDDGSRDAQTLEVLASLERQAAQEALPFAVIRQPNRGLAASRNAGLTATVSTYVSFLDGDDLVEPEFYELGVALLAREPQLGAVAAWADLFGEMVGFWNAPQPELPLLLVENQVIVPAVMRTALLRELGGYDTEQRYNYEDWELSLRLLARGYPIVTIPRYLQRYRVRSGSLYRTMTDTQNQVMRERLLEKHRATVERFAVEVALQLEHRVAATRFTGAQRPVATSPLPAGGMRTTARRLARLIGRREINAVG